MNVVAPVSPKEQPNNTVRHQRVDACARVSFKHQYGKTRLDNLYQQGSAKVRFPKNHDEFLEAVLINTAGGLTGGDRLNWDISLGRETKVVTTTQASEKAYRASKDTASVATHLQIGEASTLHWLPQEAILYEASSLKRNYYVTMEKGASLLAFESVMLGREAMGESVGSFLLHDRWRVESEGRLIFADDIRLSDSGKSLAKLNGHKAFASLLYVSDVDSEQLQTHLLNIRALCSEIDIDITAGFSMFEGKITGRILAPNSFIMRRAATSILQYLRGTDLPRVWRT